SLHWAVELGDQDLIFGWPRSDVMCRMLCVKTTPRMHLFGHDGGANLANGVREIHAVGMVCTCRPCRRASPLFGPGRMTLLQERIAQVHFQDVAALPPSDLVVGPPAEHSYRTPGGAALRYSRMETPLGWSVFVTSVDGPADELDGLFAR